MIEWLVAIIEMFLDPIGYWAIGGLFAIMEIAIVWVFVDILHFTAWKVVFVWIVVGMIFRYLMHNEWLRGNWQVYVRDMIERLFG